MPDHCHPGVALDLLYSEWFFVWLSEYSFVEWTWIFWVECLWSSEWWYPSNAYDFRPMSLGRVSRSGLWPYPRYMSSSLASEWFRVRVEKGVEVDPDSVTCCGSIFHWLMSYATTLTSFAVTLIHSKVVEWTFADKLRVLIWKKSLVWQVALLFPNLAGF